MPFMDFHTHTLFSSDSSTPPRAIIEKAISLGLSAICFTDHNDFDYPMENGKTMFALELEQYLKTMTALRQEYASKIEIFIGLEQGLTADRPWRIDSFDKDFPGQLDFIVGSSHMVHGVDPYYAHYWEGISVSEAVVLYLESILENIGCCNNYDVYGHLDYIIRYIPKTERPLSPHAHMELYEAILKALIERGKGIEINTSGWKYSHAQPHPSLDILKRYRQLGGEILTIGSDAHYPKDLAYDFCKVPDLLEAAGFRYFTYFRKRKPVFVSTDTLRL